MVLRDTTMRSSLAVGDAEDAEKPALDVVAELELPFSPLTTSSAARAGATICPIDIYRPPSTALKRLMQPLLSSPLLSANDISSGARAPWRGRSLADLSHASQLANRD